MRTGLRVNEIGELVEAVRAFEGESDLVLDSD